MSDIEKSLGNLYRRGVPHDLPDIHRIGIEVLAGPVAYNERETLEAVAKMYRALQKIQLIGQTTVLSEETKLEQIAISASPIFENLQPWFSYNGKYIDNSYGGISLLTVGLPTPVYDPEVLKSHPLVEPEGLDLISLGTIYYLLQSLDPKTPMPYPFDGDPEPVISQAPPRWRVRG